MMKIHNNKLTDLVKLDRSNLSIFLNKYMFICLVLDELAFLKFYEKQDIISSKALYKRIGKMMSYGLQNNPIALLDIWLADMQFMGLIKITISKEYDEILIYQLTEDGIRAYQNQTFHQIYANLLAAKRSRVLAMIAIGLSLISLLIPILKSVVC